MSTYLDTIKETRTFLHSKTKRQPEVGIILGSGLGGGLVEQMTNTIEIPYQDIPNFPESTVEGHSGKLIFGTYGGKDVVVMAGRFHYYEGYNMQEVTFPVRVMKLLGVHTLMVSNASGGMNRNFKVGDLMLIHDHINLFPEHPLRGKNISELGPRFPDMSEPYSLALIAKAKQIAEANNIPVYSGVYIGLQGPTFETRAEYHYMNVIGGDAVGMSTVPEVIVAIHMGMKVFGISVITDIGIREDLNTITHEEVLEAARIAAPKVALLFREVIATL